MGKIYDCFNFFNELDILELRLNILYDHVDYFVIVESDMTHSGEKKPFYLEENKDRFAKFWDKIISYKIEDNPVDFTNLSPTDEVGLSEVNTFINRQTNRFNRSTQPDYGRDFFQKESVRRALVDCDDDDIILLSDADEIPNPNVFNTELDLDNTIYSLNQYTYYYYINMLKQTDWYGTKMGLYKNVKNLSFNEVRGDGNLTTRIPDGGWHFSFMGGSEMVKKKITSYSARDLVNPRVLKSLEGNIENGVDPFFRSRLTQVDIDDTFPKYLVDNIEAYAHMIK